MSSPHRLRLLIAGIFMLVPLLARAEHPAQDCGTELSPETLRQILANQAEGLYDAVDRVEADYLVRLAFHIIQTDAGSGGPLQADLDFAVENMNMHYLPAGIQFVLTVQDTIANSTCYNTTTWAEFNTLRGLAEVNNAVDLFFVNTLSWGGNGWCGYSSFSGDAVQGIGIDNGCVGDNALVAHEVGHYFDLFHTHETVNGSECPDGSNCSTTGDLLCDTPADPGLNAANVDDACAYTGSTTIVCNGASRAFVPNPANIMSYSPRVCRDLFTTGQINRMRATLVNLRTELLWDTPDFYHTTPGGWSSSLVPRNNATATEASCSVSATLDGGTSNTSLNIAVRNGRDDYSPAHVDRVYLDNSYVRWFSFASTAGHAWSFYNNAGAHNVRGGRHSLHDSLDWTDQVPELSEGNNSLFVQYVWSPLALAQESAIYRPSPPDRMAGTYAYPNCDGFSLTNTGWWEVITVQPVSATADYDIRLHQDYTGSTAGFATTLASSNYGSGQPDWVILNRNLLGQQAWQVGVHNYDGETGGMYVERSGATTVSVTEGGSFSNQVPVNRFVDVWELNVGAEDLNKVWDLNLASPDAGDLNLVIYHSTLEKGGRSSSWLGSSNNGTSAEHLQLSFPVAGYYALLVYKDDSAERLSTIDYTLSFSLPPADLDFGTVGDTSSPFLPRGAYEPCAQWDPLLSAGLSSLTVSFSNTGLNSAAGGWNIQSALDGPVVSTAATYGSALAPAASMQHCNVDLGSVRGGRHDIAVTLDCNNEVVEADEANTLYAQYAWEPTALSNRTALTRASLPNWRNTENAASLFYDGCNQDGFSASTQYWTAVAAAPTAADQLNLHGYSYHGTDPLTALENQVVSAYGSAGNTSLIMINGNTLGNGVLRDVGLTNNRAWPSSPSLGGYTVESCQRLQDVLLGYPVLGNLNAGHLVHSYDVYLPGGAALPVFLDNRSTDDLVLAIFDRNATMADQGDALLMLDTGAVGADESGSITVGNAGWYGLAVYRRNAALLATDAPYALRVGAAQTAMLGNVDLTVVETDLDDGQMHFSLQFPDLVDGAGIPLAVDRYEYHWGYQAWDDFPGTSWHYFGQSVASQYLNFPVYMASANSSMYFTVVGYSADGTALGGSGPVGPVFTRQEAQQRLGAPGAPGSLPR